MSITTFRSMSVSLMLCAAWVTGATAGSSWQGFSDASSALQTSRFTWAGTPTEGGGNNNYYDGDMADFDGDGLPDRLLGSRYGLLLNTGGGLMTFFGGFFSNCSRITSIASSNWES